MSRPLDDLSSPPPRTVATTEDEMDALDRLFPGEGAAVSSATGVLKTPLRETEAPARTVEASPESLPSHWRLRFARPPKRALWIAAILAVIVAQAGLITYVIRRSSAVPSGPGRLVVETNPSGAAVRIDGVNRGVTPLTLTLPSGEYLTEVSLGSSRREFRIPITDGATVSRHVELMTGAPAVATSGGTGSLDLRSRPTGATVTVDGQLRGRTPVVIEQLAPGQHRVLLKHGNAEIQETLTVTPGAPLQFTAAFPVEGGPRSGWLSVRSPVQLSIIENGAVIGTTSSQRTMLPVGRHSLEFVNEQLGYRTTRTVDIGEGKVVSVVPELPNVAVNVNAQPWAEVWMGERKLGDTPMGALMLPLGVHQLVFKHPSLGERRETVTVGAGGPIRVSVDMRK